MKLTHFQIQQYDTFGFLIIPGYLSDERVEKLRATLSRMKAEESGEPDPLQHRGRVLGMFHKDPLQLELFDDPDLHDIAVQLFRDEKIRFLGDEYASFSTPADWHPDTPPDTSYESLKFGFYLDDLSRGGCLRVVPGSHHAEYSQAVEDFRKAQIPPSEIESAYSCLTNPGDLLIFNLKIWHQGTENLPGTHRRVIFWTVGQNHPEFNAHAQKFHEQAGRGAADVAWPELMAQSAPKHRLEMLDVFEAGSAKHKSLA